MKKLNIGLDYDRTVTADPELWLGFVELAKKRGHKVLLVTMRLRSERITDMSEKMRNALDRIIYTDRKAKLDYLKERQISIDIWIDDCPGKILFDYEESKRYDKYTLADKD